jgi:hypothetical protein
MINCIRIFLSFKDYRLAESEWLAILAIIATIEEITTIELEGWLVGIDLKATT